MHHKQWLACHHSIPALITGDGVVDHALRLHMTLKKHDLKRSTANVSWKEKLNNAKKTENVGEQINIVKEVCHLLGRDEEDQVGIISSLVEIFIGSPAKHQIKRVLISAFQNLDTHSRDLVAQSMSQQSRDYYKQCSNEPRKYIDVIASLMDNFSIGEKCIESICMETLQNLSSVLSSLLSQCRHIQSSVSQNQLMHNCLAGVQISNRILQKCYSTLSSIDREAITDIVSQYLKHDITVLHTGDFLMDCKTTCAINVILLLKLQNSEYFVNSVVKTVFCPQDSPVSCGPDFSRVVKGDNLCHLCLLYGIMSIIDQSELITAMHDGKCLLLDYVFPVLIKIADNGYPDSVTKLLAVKCYNMWTAKTCCCLKSGLASEKQKALLHGNEAVIQNVMSCVWTVWEDTADVIRIIAREIFENILNIHTIVVTVDPLEDGFLQNLTRKLLYDVSWSSKGKYGMLSNMVQIIGTDYILQQAPDLSTTILSQMSEHALACHASELYIQLCMKHQTENRDDWLAQWIDPLLNILSGDNRHQINYVMEYILSKILKKDKDVMSYILHKLSSDKDPSMMSSLVMCLRRGRTTGLFDHHLESEEKVNELINLSVLQQALKNIEEQVRLDAFAFVCESHKTTAVINDWELNLIKSFLPWNLNSQSPGFRQQMVSYLKKFLSRMKESEAVLLREVRKSKDGQKKDNLTKYQAFLSWLTRHLLSCLHAGSSFARRTTCLTALTLLVDIFGSSKSGFQVSAVLEANDFNVLVGCLSDTFEDNKEEAYKLLQYCIGVERMKQSYESVDSLLLTALTLAGSTRPQDSTTAAYMFRVLLLQPELLSVMTSSSRSRTFITSCSTPCAISNNQSESVLHLLTILIGYLKYQIYAAQQSLMSAACSKPIYPTLHCIRYIVRDVKFSCIPDSVRGSWTLFIAELLNSCVQIAEIVSPVVQNSSPEGNIPQEAIGNIDQNIEGLMPEYLTVCCWRSIKEVSLVLGLVCTNVPITNDNGLLTLKHIDVIGSYFKTQLLESIHRGAFELAHAGFVKMCEMLWKSSIPDLYTLPKLWLSQLMEEIQSINSKLCATRRSAGVPFYVQALVTTEPITTGRASLKEVMTDLLKLALTDESNVVSEPKVHSLNILRALFKDNRLGDDVTPFVGQGLKAAILGFKSKFWAVCNSSTLLFSALMTRIFGVKRSKDENNISKKNCQTGKAFFHKYPGLYNFILDLLDEATQNVGDTRTVHLHPSLYPLLMVLARLFPSPLEGTDTSLNLSAFVPFILRCSSSAVLRTRQMSAKALQPMMVGAGAMTVLQELIAKLPTQPGGIHNSHVHGLLLQITGVVDIIPSLDPEVRHLGYETAIQHWSQKMWLISRKNKCYIIRKEALSLTMKLVLCTGNAPLGQTLNSVLTDQQSLLSEPAVQTVPGHIEYLTTLANGLINHSEYRSYSCDSIHCMKKDNSEIMSTKGKNSVKVSTIRLLKETLMLILNCPHYEVKMIALMYLLSLSESSETDDEFVFEYVPPADHGKGSYIMMTSRPVLDKLLQMAQDEPHFECTKLVYRVLKNHTCIKDGTSFMDPTQLMKFFRFCLNSIETVTRDEVRSELLELTGFLIQPILKFGAKDDVDVKDCIKRWTEMLVCYKETIQHQQLQLAVTKILQQNRDILLKDQAQYWGEAVFTFWDILVNLLQEDDEEVKDTAASIVSQLNPGVKVMVQPFYAIDLAMNTMLQVHLPRFPESCWRTLLKWMELSTEDEVGVGGRLFDKNEMNTWREDTQLARICLKYLVEIVLMFQPSQSESESAPSGGDNSALIPDSKGNNSVSDSLSKGDKSYCFDKENLLSLKRKLYEDLPSSHGVAFPCLAAPLWNIFVLDLNKHLTKFCSEGEAMTPDPYSDVNKYIQYQINQAKYNCVKQLSECICKS